ncbi:3-oxoacyl-[acyl-carrier-protein] synthase II [Micromonospora sp. Llam0]|uniref:beta-ketoacyl-[acyl-carrier-protein] synthase family protein n=1 Tax=Micromonospora sp. Llam0 TaxID=2485143 RepID=UPI000FBF7F7F|nr:beta-ketoacyl-[acyl-carrier-protein] synthase family protein [Micromonospora sp. Llam0]ROO52000.1 3-oxoacyl-[acyl-carrier-protein] synthase II [Micromonospora sp. Llam0]
MQRTVVTSMGAVTAHGAGVPHLWHGLLQGHVAIRPVSSLDLTGHRTALGGEVDWPRRAGRDTALDYALAAAHEAMADTGITVAPHRWGVVLGTCNAGLRSAEHAWQAEQAGRQPDWRHYLAIQPQILAEALAAEFGLQGPVLSVNTACASAAHAIGHALDMIRSDQADAMLVGGTDAFTRTVFAGFNSLESLSPKPAAPYSKQRQGLSLGEGAGMLVLAKLAVAQAAGASILAEVLGYGLSADGYHPTAPHPQGEGAARAITAALADAGVAAGAVDYINGHGTGTLKNDAAESNAVRAALGTHAEKTPLSSTKSMVGHLLGAAGAVEAIATVLAVQHQTAPPTANFADPDPGCGLDPVPGAARQMPIEVALSNNFAFAGANATVAFGAYFPEADPAERAAPEDVVVTGIGVLDRGDDLHVDLDLDGVLPARQRRRLDRLSLLAIAAGSQALADAGLRVDADSGDRIGVVLGSGLGPVESIERFAIPVLAEGPGAANPGLFPNTVHNAAAGQVAMHLGTRGPTSTIAASHAAGTAALCVAHDLLRAGRADALLCVGVDTPSELTRRVYAHLPLLKRLRPAEGGVALVLERRSVALARGARILATVAGRAITSDAIGIGRWDRDGAGIERAMRFALAQAAIPARDLCGVWTNTIGVAAVDRPEDRAIRRVIGAAGVPIHRPSRRRAQPIGVRALEAVALALQADQGRFVLINSSSLGGTHVSLILKRTEK